MSSSIISLKDIYLRRNGKEILSGISWRIEPGEHWALIGANGSGKTVTLRMLLGHLWPTEGTVEVLGRRFGSYDLRKLRAEIGWVNFDIQYQFLRRSDSVSDVVVSGLFGTVGLLADKPGPDVLEAAMERLDALGIAHSATRQFSTLSYGEQKRVLIARALITDPKLLILDEPCTGLDLASREHFLQAVAELAADGRQTVIFVTHHTEELLPFISHALLLKSGKVVTQGRKEDVLEPELLEQTFGFPVEVLARDGRFWTRLKHD